MALTHEQIWPILWPLYRPLWIKLLGVREDIDDKTLQDLIRIWNEANPPDET